MEVEGAEEMPDRCRCAFQERPRQAENADGIAGELVVAVDPSEPEKHIGHHRVPGGSGVVVELLSPRHEPVVVDEEATALRVAEPFPSMTSEQPRLLEPAKLAGGEVELEVAVRDIRVVLEIPVDLRLAVPVAPEEPPFGIGHPLSQEERQPVCDLEVVGAGEHAACLGERRQGEAVPGGDGLVVSQRLRPSHPSLEQLLAGGRVFGDGLVGEVEGCYDPRSCPPA